MGALKEDTMLVQMTAEQLSQLMSEAVARGVAQAASNHQSPDDLLTLAEAAKLLRTSTVTLRKQIKTEDCPGKKFGTEWRFRRDELEAWRQRIAAKGNISRIGSG